MISATDARNLSLANQAKLSAEDALNLTRIEDLIIDAATLVNSITVRYISDAVMKELEKAGYKLSCPERKAIINRLGDIHDYIEQFTINW